MLSQIDQPVTVHPSRRKPLPHPGDQALVRHLVGHVLGRLGQQPAERSRIGASIAVEGHSPAESVVESGRQIGAVGGQGRNVRTGYVAQQFLQLPAL